MQAAHFGVAGIFQALVGGTDIGDLISGQRFVVAGLTGLFLRALCLGCACGFLCNGSGATQQTCAQYKGRKEGSAFHV